MSRLLVLLALVPLVASGAGCMEALESRLGRVRAEPPSQASYAATFEDVVAPSHAKTYEFPVAENATEARVSMTLALSGDAPAEVPFAPAQLEVSFRGPDGGPVGERGTLTPTSRTLTLAIREFTGAGTYSVVVTGNGLSGPPGGASYNATLDVAY